MIYGFEDDWEIFDKCCGECVKVFNLEMLGKFQRSFGIILLKIWKQFVEISKESENFEKNICKNFEKSLWKH